MSCLKLTELTEVRVHYGKQGERGIRKERERERERERGKDKNVNDCVLQICV